MTLASSYRMLSLLFEPLCALLCRTVSSLLVNQFQLKRVCLYSLLDSLLACTFVHRFYTLRLKQGYMVGVANDIHS